MKAVLLENHPLLRAALAQVLAHPTLGLEVSAPEWSQARPDQVPDCTDLLVIGADDAHGPLGASQLSDVIARSTPRHVVVLAAQVSAEEAYSAMACGVDAYVAKAQSAEVLLATLHLVLAGGQSYPPLMLRGTPAGGTVPMMAIDAVESAQRLNLSQRQYEVLVLLSRGHSVKGVGRLLGISEATVKTHACTLYRRLNVRNKSEAVYAAMRLGIPLELHGGLAATADAGLAGSAEAPDVFVSTEPAQAAIASADAPSRPAATDHTAQSRWAAMTRAFGMTAAPAGGPAPVRVANGTSRAGVG